jgi:hypothetical protein
MSKKNKNAGRNKTAAARLIENNAEANDAAERHAVNENPSGLLGRRWLAALVIGFVALGALGAGLKYLETDAARQIAARNAKTSLDQNKRENWLNAVNPFLPNPTPAPQLAKEYIYAGSRLLAVEDTNASAAPPADLAVWRPSNGTWYVMGASGAMQAAVQFGVLGDVPLPGDYDGDGKTDFCVYRPDTNTGTATWYILKSSDNSFYGAPFGSSPANQADRDAPVPADYDGDGRTDIAVYRPTNGTWYAVRSSNQLLLAIQFGADLNTDVPQPADYDGDGKADPTVWRKTEQRFYTINSSVSGGPEQYTSAVVGQASSDKPVSADYDGDGKSDYAVRSGTSWLIRYSSTGAVQAPITWGAATDTTVQNDYDGDGKVDLAVWRGADGYWFIRQSSRLNQADEMRAAQWGGANDIPVPVFYRR